MQIPPSVRCILFDAVGTLIFAQPPVSAIYAAAASEFGMSLDEAIIAQRFADALAAHYCHLGDPDWQNTSQSQEVNRWRSIVASVFPELTQTDTLFQRLWNHFAQPTSWRLYADVVPHWRELVDRGLKLGVASNFDDRLTTICRGLLPLDRSAYVFISSQLGFRKPAVQFFRAIESEMKLSPHELLLIGDDRENDYRAAQSAGWHAIHLDRSSVQAIQDSIHSLADLL